MFFDEEVVEQIANEMNKKQNSMCRKSQSRLFYNAYH